MGTGILSVNDIVTRVQRTFGDESAVQVQVDDILRWINDACREVVMQHENLLQGQAFLDSVDSQQSYDPPFDCFTINAIYYRDNPNTAASYYALRFLSRPELDQLADGWQGNDYGTGVPQVYTRGENNSILLFPIPDSGYPSAIKVVYARYANDVTSTSDPIDLPPYYHSYVEHFCMMKAYEMDEDWESADHKAQLVQSTIDFNNNREQWFGRETYPTISTNWGDYV